MTSTRQETLSDIAAHLIYPDGIVSSEFPKLRQVAGMAGIQFDWWQDELGMLMWGKRKDGLYAAGVSGCVMSLPRQIGKTYTVGGCVTAKCLLSPHTTALWTAHRTRTSGETFKTMSALADSPKMSKYVKGVRRANGQEEIEFKNGSRILFGAREQGFGRGFSNISIEIFDETQILTEKALDDMLPATSAARNPLIFYMGTPPRPSDPGEVFTDKRDQLIGGQDRDGLYLEFSADRDCDIDDRGQWHKANPSYPHRTPETAILRLRRQLSEDSFRREMLGIWDQRTVAGAIPLDDWQACETSSPNIEGVRAYGIDIDPHREHCSIAAAIRHDDGTVHTELVKYEPADTLNVPRLADWLKARWGKTAAIVIDTFSPAFELVNDLQAQGVKITLTSSRDISVASGRLLTLINKHELSHTDRDKQLALFEAVENVATRPIGKSGGFTWNRMGTDIDISPLMAVTLAVHGCLTSKRKPGRKQKLWV